MVFLGVYKAVYDYAPQAEGELTIKEGDLLYVLEKGEDDWWKAKKKAENDDEPEEEGLVPNNYVEEAAATHKAKALYDYTRQTDEEISFTEDASLDVYDTSDPDWTLVGLNDEYGFAPSNYIELLEASAAPAAPAPPSMPPRKHVGFAPEPEVEHDPEPQQPHTPSSPEESPQQSPAAALAGILAQKSASTAGAQKTPVSPPPNIRLPPRQPQYTPEESDEEPPQAPALPQRPPSDRLSPPLASPASPVTPASPPYNRTSTASYDQDDAYRHPISPSGYHLFNIHEMVSHMGKNKKMPMTLGINIPKGIIMISPEKSRDGPQQEWTADKLTHYSIEGKHVFMELVRPSKSIDFHAGAKDTAQEIVSYLGELAGAAKAEGLREVLAAGSGTSNVQKKGHMLYDFMAQGDDEVSVAVGDEVLILDDTKSDEWWQVRRLKNGKEGAVPSSYVEITETIAVPPASHTGINAGRSAVEQNRLEEERLARESSKKRNEDRQSRVPEVGPGLQLPERHSSLMSGDDVDSKRREQRKRESMYGRDSSSKSKPNPAKVRTWTDRSGSFRVDAEFIGLREGKIHLHKINGVKIAVPVPKMSIEDLEYVENLTGVSLDEDKPLSEIKKRGTPRDKDKGQQKAGISVEQPKKPEYDWFDFFLQCGVNPQICERYASSFARDQMGEESMPDISEKLLRTLGLKEGDILRVMKFLDGKYGRTGDKDKRSVSFNVEDGDANGTAGGLFSGPGGSLKNNTRKGRPAPPIQTNDVVDPKAFEQKTDDSVKKPADAAPTPLASAPTPEKKVDGFEDNAWEVKPSRTPPATTAPTSSAPAQASAPAPAPSQAPTLTGSLSELSLLSPPLQPTTAPQPQPQSQPQPAVQQPTQPAGATPSLFEQLAKAPPAPAPQIQPQQTAFGPQQQFAPPRQRPQAPTQVQSPGGLIAPPPPRAASAPQNFNQSAFGPPPLQPQLTGYQQPQPTGIIHAQVAPPGQSLQDLQQQRLQQQFAEQQALQMQRTGFPPQSQFGQFPNGIMPQPTGFPQQAFGQFPQQLNPLGPQPAGSPFADPPRPPYQPMMSQPTGIPTTFSPSSLQPQATGINAFLPPALQPQRTGVFANQIGNQTPPNVPPVPPLPSQPNPGGLAPAAQPLVPQKTGPAPPVRFGVQNAAQKKLVPQPTGRRANLSQATPQNPFGF